MATLVICIGVLSRDVLDLEMFFSGVDWVIVEMLFLATPYILSDVKIFQGWDISWWKWSTLIICVGFRKLYGLDLESFVLDLTW